MKRWLAIGTACLLGACAGQCGGDAAPEAVEAPSADAGNAADAGAAAPSAPMAAAPAAPDEGGAEDSSPVPSGAGASAVAPVLQHAGVATARTITQPGGVQREGAPPLDLTGARERELQVVERVVARALARCEVLTRDKVTVTGLRYGLDASGDSWAWTVEGEEVPANDTTCLLRGLPVLTMEPEAPERAIRSGAVVIDGDARPRRQLRYVVADAGAGSP